MSIQEHMDSVKQALYADMNKNRDVVFTGLVENAVINYIPESLFVNYFLPLFMGGGSNPNWVVEWISIAGTPMAEVGVIKDGTNEVLYRVPGILSTKNMHFNSKGGPGLSDVFGRYEQLSSNIPAQGASFLNSALTNLNKGLMEDHSLDFVRSTWLTILQRYNLAPQNTAPVAAAALTDYFDY
jgi:hypothetical protein